MLVIVDDKVKFVIERSISGSSFYERVERICDESGEIFVLVSSDDKICYAVTDTNIIYLFHPGMKDGGISTFTFNEKICGNIVQVTRSQSTRHLLVRTDCSKLYAYSFCVANDKLATSDRIKEVLTREPVVHINSSNFIMADNTVGRVDFTATTLEGDSSHYKLNYYDFSNDPSLGTLKDFIEVCHDLYYELYESGVLREINVEKIEYQDRYLPGVIDPDAGLSFDELSEDERNYHSVNYKILVTDAVQVLYHNQKIYVLLSDDTVLTKSICEGEDDSLIPYNPISLSQDIRKLLKL